MINYIYLIQDDSNFKVGYSKDPKRRFRAYVTHNTNIRMLGIYPVESKDIEKLIHMELLKNNYRRAFDKKRKKLSKEWFEGSITSFEFQKILDNFLKRRVK